MLETVVIIKVEFDPYLSLIFMGMNFELKWYMKRRDSIIAQYVTLILLIEIPKPKAVHEGKKLNKYFGREVSFSQMMLNIAI